MQSFAIFLCNGHQPSKQCTMPTTSRLSPHAVAFEPAGSIPTKSDNDHHLVGVPKKEVADQNQPPNKNGKDNNKNKNNNNNDPTSTNFMNGGRSKKTRSRTRACRQRRKQLNPNRIRKDNVRKIDRKFASLIID